MKKFEEKYNHKRYRAAYNTTVFSITVVMFMLGLLALVVYHTNRLSDYVREHIGIQLELSENLTAGQALSFKDSLDATAAVRRSVYISKAEAARQLSDELGEDFVSFMGYIPLPATIELFLNSNYTSPDSLQHLESRLRRTQAVQNVSYQKSLVDLINQNLDRLITGVLLFAALLLVISVILIYNTIRLAVFARRMLIKSMILVGATQAFIRKPFIMAGIRQGLISGLLAAALLAAVVWLSQMKFPQLGLLTQIIPLVILFCGMLLFAVLITFLSNYFAVKKYLKINSEELY